MAQQGDHIDYGSYFDELLHEMRALNSIKFKEPEKFCLISNLLKAEISRVWSLLSGETTETTSSFKMEEKILIPKLRDSRGRNCNLIGRILGPCGLSVKQLESETGCVILIRGEGSVKDEDKEKRLKHHPGWEHLKEPLHVVVKSVEESEELAKKKLKKAIKTIKKLLVPGYDEYKKNQLVTHAIINGTYRQDYRKKK